MTGFLFVLLVAALAWMVPGERKPVSSSAPAVPAVAGKEVAGQLKKNSLQTSTRSRPDTASRTSPVGTAVSQAQLDLVKKREEARIRRDEMLAVRAQTINRLGPGNTGE
ncbi:MAG: hypothetical protein KKG47_03030 [Proteobacteria bacterium]|nr:hypothetical protein [Pseudomonadota bacterium]MBU1738867.1 hypothetical protein [Pseudomonadota bacterium]